MPETGKNRQSKRADKPVQEPSKQTQLKNQRNPAQAGFSSENLKKRFPFLYGTASFLSHLPLLTKIGILLFIISLGLLGVLFYPAITKEIWFLFNKPDPEAQVNLSKTGRDILPNKTFITPVDMDFSIIIPKIGANTKVFKNVDPQNSFVYQRILTQGVAHALGTSLPDRGGNTFIFAHSSDNFYNANRYNAVFYLLNKMEKGDLFYLVYEKEKYTYEVTETAIVDSSAIEYMRGSITESKATLMTCWPPGTTLKRLVVVGKKI